jgi:hypothetical protein
VHRNTDIACRHEAVPGKDIQGGLRDLGICPFACTSEAHFKMIDHAFDANDPLRTPYGRFALSKLWNLSGEGDEPVVRRHPDGGGIDLCVPVEFLLDIVLEVEVGFHTGLLSRDILSVHSERP